jgi:hypothetical protein
MNASPSLLVAALLLALVIAGCDATGAENKVILNANSPEPPTVEYAFDYKTNGANAIEVQSGNTDDLSSILSTNGFRRTDVVSARIDSVQLERISPKAAPVSNVFDYLTGTTLYLGPDANSPRIAEGAIQSTARTVPLPVRTADVTDVVKSGETPAFLRLNTDSNVPDRRDRVTATVYFRIEVQGV